MADNTTLNTNDTSGDVIATDDIGGVKYQRVKLIEGADGTNDGDISSANPLPVGLTDGTTAAGIDVSGHLQVDIAADSVGIGGGTEYTLGTDTYSEGTTKTKVAGAVRNDTLATLADTDNELAPLQVDADGALYTHANNLISTNNSSTTPLGDGATFTGTGDDVSQYTSVVFTLDASHDSATDSMQAQFSTDNTNWDDVYSWTYTAASGSRRFQFPVTAQYFRIVYTNSSGAAQTHFRLQTIYHAQNVLTSIHRLQNDMSPDRSATVVKSVLFAQAAGSGDFTAVDATASGNLKTSIQEISDGLDIGAGNAGSETQRVSISTDDVNLSGILADTANMDTNLGTLAGAVTGSEMQVDVVTSALPTGAATAANQLPDGHAVTVDNAAGASAVNIQDGGNSITVDGTVTETNSAAILADTANMDTNLGTVAGAVTGSEMQVDVVTSDGIAAEGAALGNGILMQGDDGTNRQNVAVDATTGNLQVDIDSSALPTGAATAANQLPDGHAVTVDNASGGSAVNIQDGGNVISVDDGASSLTVDAPVGTPVNVQIGNGTNTAGVDGSGHLQVDIAADSAGIGGGTQYTEDDAAAANPVGTQTVMVRADTPATVTSTDGDVIAQRATNYGAAYSQIVDSSGNYVDTFGGGTQYTEDAAAASDPVGTASILVRQDTPASEVTTNGDNVAQRGTTYGAAYCQILDSSGNFINSFGGSGGTSHADDAAFSIGSASSITPAGFLADDTTPDSVDEGDVGVPRMTLTRKPYAVITDPTSEQNAGVDASGHLQVDIAASSATVTVDNGGTFATQVDGAALTALQLIDNSAVAPGAAAAGGVTQVGLEARSTEPTAVDNGDAVTAMATLLGKQVTQPYAQPGSFWSYASPSAVTDTSDDTAKAAAGAGIRNYITGVQVFNGSDTVGTEVVIKDTTIGVLWRGWAEETGGGCSAHFDPPLKPTANEAILVSNVTTASSTYFNLQGYVAAE